MIPFAKAHACGNDFLIVQEKEAGTSAYADLARRLCSRNTGVGADGVEFFSWAGKHRGRIHLYNADGSVAEISGNGTRCVAAWMAQAEDSHPGDELCIETDAGVRVCRIVSRSGQRCTISSPMGVPEIREGRVNLRDGRSIVGAVVSTGNPHFVIQVQDAQFTVMGSTWQEIGEEISHHPDFPRQTNVEFVHRRTPGEVEIRIFERGVGPTTSSGTGTCASAAASIRFWQASRMLDVVAPGGAQTVNWPDDQAEILLTGPAELICSGEAY
jgi:diaminopimelate epimerase